MSVEELLESPPVCSSMQKRKNRVSDHLTPDGETQFDGAGEADEGERPKPRGSWSIQSGAVHCPQADATVWVKRNVL